MVGTLVVAALSCPARADALDQLRRDTLIAEAGAVRQQRGDERGWGARLYVAPTGRPFAASLFGARAFTALGAELARVRVWAPRADVDEAAVGSVVSYGLAARLGLRWPSGPYAFVGVAPIISLVTPHSQAAAVTLRGVGQHRGVRLTVGVTVFHVVVDATWERAGGVDRIGVSLGAAL